jgi:uncharacterized protein YigE (DUF2233 family)
MLRAFLCSAVVTLLTGAVMLAQTEPRNLNKDQQQKGNQREATITSVDPQHHSVTVRMKDDTGKEVTRTFQLTGEVRMLDNEGHAAAVDIFQSGNEVLVVEEQGKLIEIRKSKNPGEKK